MPNQQKMYADNTGGYNTIQSPFNSDPSNAALLKNAFLSEDGTIQKRPGAASVFNELGGGWDSSLWDEAYWDNNIPTDRFQTIIPYVAPTGERDILFQFGDEVWRFSDLNKTKTLFENIEDNDSDVAQRLFTIIEENNLHDLDSLFTLNDDKELDWTTFQGKVIMGNKNMRARKYFRLQRPVVGDLESFGTSSLASRTYWVRITQSTTNGESKPSKPVSFDVSNNERLRIKPPSQMESATSWAAYVSEQRGQATMVKEGVDFNTNVEEPSSGFVFVDDEDSDADDIIDKTSTSTDGDFSGGTPIWESPATPYVSADYSLQFDGMEEYVDFGEADDLSELDITGDLTIEAWVYVRGFNSDHTIITWKNNHTNAPYDLLVNTNKGLTLERGGDTATSNNDVITDQTWHHVSVVSDTNANDVTFYVDGSAEGNPSFSPTISSADGELSLSRSGETKVFDGRLDDVRVWSQTRSSSEVSNNKDVRLTGDESQLEAYWPLNRSPGNQTPDRNEAWDVTHMPHAAPFSDVWHTHEGRVVAADIVDDLMALEYSGLNDETDWDFTQSGDTAPGRIEYDLKLDTGDEIRSMNSIHKRLVIYFGDHIVTMAFPEVASNIQLEQVMKGRGAVGRRCVTPIGNDLFWVSKDGVQTLSSEFGQQLLAMADKNPSHQIDSILTEQIADAIDSGNRDKIVSAYYPQRNWYILGVPTLINKGNVVRSRVYVYDIRFDTWSFFSGFNVRALGVTTDNRWFIGTEDTLYELDDDPDRWTDDGSEYEFVWKTPWLYLEDPNNLKTIKHLIFPAIANAPTEIDVKILFDFGSDDQEIGPVELEYIEQSEWDVGLWDEAIWDGYAKTLERHPTGGRARAIQVIFSHEDDTSLEIPWYMFEFDPGGQVP